MRDLASAPVATAEFELDRYLDQRRPLVEAELDRTLGSRAPEPLAAAMRYAVLGPGKRLRPMMVLAAAEAVSPPGTLLSRIHAAALPMAAAVELIHAYSLVHDDLPAMDDDDLRRGRPTVHKAYDDATAILVGDALQALAFAAIAQATALSSRRRVLAVATLAHGAGQRGMVGGQMLDLAAEGRFSARESPDLPALETLAGAKTGALLSAAAELGAIAGGAGPITRRKLAEFGRTVGLSFQIADDLLDLEGDPERVGKKTGKDLARGKATFPGLMGADGARKRAEALSLKASRIVRRFENEGGAALAAMAGFAVSRKS